MAYDALDSLAKKLDLILDHDSNACFSRPNAVRRRFYCSFLVNSCFTSSNGDDDEECCDYCAFLGKKLEIQSLHENAVFLSSFLVDYPGEAANLEARFTNAAKQARHTFDCDDVVPDENDPKWEHFCQELEKSIEEFDSLLQEAKRIKSSSKNHSFSPRLNPRAKETIVGFEEGLIDMKGQLCGEPSSHLEIIPIVGMGGIGKTTFARYAYQDPSTTHHFDVRAWTTVSQSSSARIILSSLLSSVDPSNKEEYQRMDKELLVLHGYRYLKNRRYLIVMDDMWDTNVWDDVRMAFPDDCNGSRIIITTRDLDVASYVDSSNKPHNIQLMSVDESWRLLKEVVFGQENCLPELEKIGKHIAEKCRGLPLAIVVIAGVLSKLQKEQDSWEKIARNVSEAVNTSDDAQFSDILSLSYMHLPLYLRRCFLYMACFPEDYEIKISTLIRLWVAEGFVISNESKDMEELGYEYLEDLAGRSLVLIEKKRHDGKIKTVRIHDVLRDLCIRKSRDENFLHIINEFEGSFPEGIENSHRLSICCNISGVIPNMNSSPIHTILVFNHWAFDSWKSFRLLRVVHALSVTLTSSTSNSSITYIGSLIHLRYLALSCESIIRTLELASQSLYQLQNLQSLIFLKVLSGDRLGYVELDDAAVLSEDGMGSLTLDGYVAWNEEILGSAELDDEDLTQTYIKFEIWRLPRLRHFILMDSFIPDPSTKSSCCLQDLHTLSRIKDFKCSEWILEMIPNLKKLGIIYSYEGTYETGWSSYSLNNLVHLRKLEKLSLYAEPYPNIKNEVLSDNIGFPETLKKLTLSGCKFPWEDMGMIGSLPNLEVLKLMRHACDGTKWETSEGEFCQLKVLLIDSTDLHQWIIDDSSFPMLERLTLYECGSLIVVPNGVGDIPTLQLIEVDIRNLSVVESVKSIEEEQQSYGNDLLQVRFLKSRSWGIFR